jgi:hypothetical protein
LRSFWRVFFTQAGISVKLDIDRLLALFLIQTPIGVMGLVMLPVFPLAAPAS